MFENYQNNELATTKVANQVEYCTKSEFEARIKAIAKSKRDIAWWAEKFFRIIPTSGGLQTIKLYQKQKELLQHLVANDRSIVLASRQVGKTTCYTVFCMWLATLFSEKKIMICANKLQTAIEIMDRLRLAYEYLPSWIKPGIKVYNKGEITFANKSSIRAFATSSSASRGFSGNVVIIDEMAFIPKNIIDEFFASVMPVISSSKASKAIVVSTPNGTSGLYYDIWKQATSKEVGKNAEGWKPFRIDWWEVPGRDEEWKNKQIASIGMQRWSQEFCNEFIASSTTQKLIPDDIIEKFRIKLSEMKLTGELKGKQQRIVSMQGDRQYEFTMWHGFDTDKTYLATADVAEGTGGDSSVLYVWDVTDLTNITMCAKFSSPAVSTIEFAFITDRILQLYNKPWLACESNGIGAGYLDSLRITYNYENIVREGKDNKYGITSHVQVKGRACLWLREMFTTQGIGWTIYDKDLIDEMGTFVKKESKVHMVYNAILGSHDDHIMALCWAAWMLNPEVVETYYIVTEAFKSTLDKILPKMLAPIAEYTTQELNKICNDPLHQEFVEFKNEMMKKLNVALKYEQKSNENDNFKYRCSFDMMFFNDNGDGTTWGSPWTRQDQAAIQSAMNVMQTKRPTFYINAGIW